MPERQRVVKELAEEILGRGIHWHFDVAKPEGAQDALDKADLMYRSVVEEVNWSRIVQEAFVRCHRQEDHLSTDDWNDFTPIPCAACIRAELLVEHSWERGGFSR